MTVSGERDQADPFLRIRAFEIPSAALGSLCEAVRISGGSAQMLPLGADTRLADGELAGMATQLAVALDRVRPGQPDLVCAANRAIRSFREKAACGWRCVDRTLRVAGRPLVMGILNITPDSFSDGGDLLDPGRAEDAAHRMVECGADILDIGGESTRPGSRPTPELEELNRVVPVLDRLAGSIGVPVSIDTSKAVVARAAIDRGAAIVNDISALRCDPEMIPLICESSVGVVLMHMQGTPSTMQLDPHYRDVVREVFLFLHRRVRTCLAAGIDASKIALDPGIGFGKQIEHNLQLIRDLSYFTSMGLAVMVGPSRKGFLGQILNLPAKDRLEGTVAACVSAALSGVSIVRVHEVQPVVRALKVAEAIRAAGPGNVD